MNTTTPPSANRPAPTHPVNDPRTGIIKKSSTAQLIQPGAKVTRIASDYTGGRKGEVIAIDTIRNRARIYLPAQNRRTWVRFADLALTCSTVAR